MVSEVHIEWVGGAVTGKIAGDGPTGVLLAHGAGVGQDHPAMASLRDALADGGLRVMTFNYPYVERGSKRPDPQERLLACHRAAAELLFATVDALFLAGRSMGARMATYLVAEGFGARGLVLYAYPLHPAGKPEKLRIDQFPAIEIPMLFFQGTRDPLARMELFEKHIASLPNAEVEILEGAGHGPGRGGWPVERMTERYAGRTISWIRGRSSGESSGSRA